MTRTLRFGTVELNSTRERAGGHDFEDVPSLPPPAHLAHGTPWPLAALPPEVNAHRAAVARPFLDEISAIDHALTVPVSRQELDPEAEPLPPIDDIGTRTIMGIGAGAVGSAARVGRMEAPGARREPRATPDEPYSQWMPPVNDKPIPPRVIVSSSVAIAHGSRQVVPPIQLLHLPPEELRPELAFEFLPREPVRAKGKRTSSRSSSGYRVLGIFILAIAVAALAAYIGAMVFYAFSNSWVMPIVVSQSDDKVVSLKSGLAAQQNQRDRLAAELEETSRALAAQKDPRSEIAQKAGAQRKILEASIARQDEIIKGLEQSPYLRALADRAGVALVPYDNLDRVAPGTAVFGCRVAMVMCREVGRVLEILPGEVAFKHPRREKMMRGQLIELQLSAPDAAAQDVLFLGGAPLRF
jgi:hypothetical protein